MNHYAPLERNIDGKKSGIYHYTRTNDKVTFPVGNCADGCPGHATPEEACEHQRQYELDHAHFNSLPLDSLQRYECEVCKAVTNSYAMAGVGMSRPRHLCDAHLNREGLEKVLKVGESWSS